LASVIQAKNFVGSPGDIYDEISQCDKLTFMRFFLSLWHKI